MDRFTVTALTQVIDDRGNQRIDSTIAKKKITAILHRRSVKRVLRDLNEYVSTLEGNAKGQTVLVVIMALLRLDLDAVPVLAQEIQDQGYLFKGSLYGGLFKLLCGNSDTFSFQLTWMEQNIKNPYERIEWWADDYFWNHIEMFMAVRLLYDIQPELFEKLVLEDKSRVILRSMAHGHMDIRPTDVLLQKLLKSEDRIHHNFALAFYTQSITNACTQMQNKALNRIRQKELKQSINHFMISLDTCSIELRAELLTNYLLVHQYAFPEAFARELVGAELQTEFAHQITGSGKVRSIHDLAFVAKLIMKVPACNQEKRRISKKLLLDAVLYVFMQFIQGRNGIYILEMQQQNDIKTVIQSLTVKQKKHFGQFLEKQDKLLMVSALDKLVRYQIYLEDFRQHEIIQCIQSFL